MAAPYTDTQSRTIGNLRHFARDYAARCDERKPITNKHNSELKRQESYFDMCIIFNFSLSLNLSLFFLMLLFNQNKITIPIFIFDGRALMSFL